MPVFNAATYLKEAIQSIIDQTFTDYTLLLINDGSTDESEAVIKSFSDERIWYRKHETNKGLINTLNEGLELAQSEYIIRMDADDISHPDRFEKQIAFMDANPAIDVSGTWFSILNSNDVVTRPVTNDECKVKLLKNTVLGHPTAIFRAASILNANLKYNESFIYIEDYKLWADASIRGLKLANIPELLLQYRVHGQQVSTVKAAQQSEMVKQINGWYALHYFGDLLKNQLELYIQLINSTIKTYASFTEARILACCLKAENRAKHYFNIDFFESFMDGLLELAAARIYILCIDCNIKVLGKSLFDKDFYFGTTMYQKAKFIFKSIQNSFFG